MANTFPLGDVVKPTRPRVKPSDHSHLPFIGMEHVEAHSMKLLGTVPAGTMKSSAVHFKPGDVLYGRLRPYLNKVYRPNFEGLCSAEFIVLPENEHVEGAYLQYFLNSSAFVRYTSHLNAGDRPRVDFDQLAPYEIPLPSKPAQRAIVAEIEKQFSRLDDAVAGLKRVKANLKRYKAAILKAAVEGRLVPTEADLARREGRNYETGAQLQQRILETRRSQWQGKGKYKEPAAPDTTDLPELAEGWVRASIEQISSLVTDGDHNPPKRTATGIRHLTAKHVRNWRLDPTDCTCISSDDADRVFKRYNPQSGDLIVTCVGTIGRTAIVPEGFAFSPDRNLAAVRLLAELVSPKYIQLVLESPDHQKFMHGVSGSTAQPHLYLGDLRAMLIPLPPVADQHSIVAEVDRLLSIAREAEAEVDTNLKRAQALRQSSLSKAFRSEGLDG